MSNPLICLSAEGDAFTCWDQGRRIKRGAPRCSILMETALDCTTHHVVLDFLDHYEKSLGDKGNVGLRHTHNFKYPSHCCNSGDEHKCSVQRMKAFVEQKIIDSDSKSLVTDLLITLIFSKSLEEINELLKTHSNVRVSYWGRREIYFEDHFYKGSISLDRAAEELRKIASERRKKRALTTEERIAGLKLVDRIREYYRSSDESIDRMKFTRIFSRMRENSRCFDASRFHIEEDGIVKMDFREYSIDQFDQTFICLSAEGDAFTCWDQGRHIKRGAPRCSILMETALDCTTHHVVLDFLDHYEKSLGDKGNVGLRHTHNFKYPSHCCNSGDEHKCSVQRMKAFVEQKIIDSDSKSLVTDLLITLIFSKSLEEINELLKTHSNVRVSYWGRREIYFEDHFYKGSISLDRAAEELRKIASERRKKRALTTEERIAGLKLVDRIREYYRSSDESIDRMKFTRIFSRMRENSRCFDASRFHIEEDGIVERDFREYSIDQFYQTFGTDGGPIWLATRDQIRTLVL